MRPGSAYRVSMELTSHAVPIKSFSYNPSSHEFYWTSPALGMIGRYNVDIGERSKNEVWLTGIEEPSRVAVDWITGNIYYSQLSSSTVSVCGEVEGDAVCAPLCSVPVSTITMLALDPREGRMFVGGFTRVHSGYPRGAVYPFTMDGEAVEDAAVMGADKTGIPSGLVLDTVSRRVYWSDLTSRDITVCTYEGTLCLVVVSSVQPHPHFLTLYESKLYWLAGSQGFLYSHDIVQQKLQQREDLKLPAHSHSLMFVHSSLVSPNPVNPCIILNCSSLCLLTLTSARCACPSGSIAQDSLSKSCIYPTPRYLSTPPAITSTEVSDSKLLFQQEEVGEIVPKEAAENTKGKVNGVTLAVVIILLLVVVVVLLLFFYKHGYNRKKPDMELMFTNPSYNSTTPGTSSVLPDREMSAMQILRRGNTTGYDNPCFDSPVDFFKKLGQTPSSMEWPDSPAIGSRDPSICEGSSTPLRRNTVEIDTDSAFQEPSTAASSLDTDTHHLAMDDDFDQLQQQHRSVSFYKDKKRLISS